MYLKIQTNL